MDFISATADSLAQTYRLQSKEVLSLIGEWQSDCTSKLTTLKSQKRLGKREALLVTIALTYSRLPYNQEPNESEKLNVETAFSELLEIYKYERHRLTRQIIAESIAELIKRDFSTLSPYLSEFISLSSQSENESLLNSLKSVYLVQRSELQAGERIIDIDSKKYPIWFKKENRKKTFIEQVLLAWIKDEGQKERQKFAARALMGFVRDFESKEFKKIELLKAAEAALSEQYRLSTQPTTPAQPVIPERPRESVYLSRFIPWLATRQSIKYRSSVSHLLPETAQQGLLGASRVSFLIDKLRSDGDKQLIGISSSLNKAVWWSKYFRPIAITSSIVAFISVFWIGAAIEEARYRREYEDSYRDDPSYNPTPVPSDTPLRQTPTQPQVVPAEVPLSPPSDAVYARIVGNDPTEPLKNVRAGSNTNEAVLFTLPVGSRVQIVGSERNADNFLWYEIYSPAEDATGWIASQLIDIE